MLFKEIEWKHGSPVCVDVEIVKLIAFNGNYRHSFAYFDVVDEEGSAGFLSVYGDLTDFKVGSKLRVDGVMTQIDGDNIVNHKDHHILWSYKKQNSDSWLQKKNLITVQDCREKIADLIQSYVLNTEMKTFIEESLSDPELFRIFCHLPASEFHHHNEKGGLFRHSLECAHRIIQLLPEASDKRDICIVAALFHDLGKVWYEYNQGLSSSAKLIHHEHLIQDLLSRPLQNLRMKWPDAEIGLLHCWLWKMHPYQRKPHSEEAELVHIVDLISATTDNFARGFSGSESWRNFSHISEYQNKKRLIWRTRRESNK